MNEIDEEIVESTNERIGFGTRLGAYLLDLLVILIFGWLLGSIVGVELAQLFFGEQIEQFNEMSDQFDSLEFDFAGVINKALMISAGTSLITVVLFILEGAFGQSVGKMLLKIVNTNVDGTKADAGKLWLRSFLKYASTLLSLIAGIIGVSILGTIASIWWLVIFVGFFIALGDNKQTIHDMIAKTVVSRRK